MFFFPTLWHLLFLQGLLFFSSSPSSLRRALWKRRRRGKNLRWRSDLSDKFFFGWGDGGSPLEIGPLPSSLFQIRKEGLFFVGGRLEWEIIDLGIPGWFLGFRPRNQSTQTHTSTFFGGSGSLKFAKRELDKLYFFLFDVFEKKKLFFRMALLLVVLQMSHKCTVYTWLRTMINYRCKKQGGTNFSLLYNTGEFSETSAKLKSALPLFDK